MNQRIREGRRRITRGEWRAAAVGIGKQEEEREETAGSSGGGSLRVLKERLVLRGEVLCECLGWGIRI